jgi:hypothetical protein
MQYVYVLATYGEYGLEERVATVDRVSVPVLLERFLGDGFTEQNRTDATHILADLLRQSDQDLSSGKHDLMPGGWGGVQLYVLKLQ